MFNRGGNQLNGLLHFLTSNRHSVGEFVIPCMNAPSKAHCLPVSFEKTRPGGLWHIRNHVIANFFLKITNQAQCRRFYCYLIALSVLILRMVNIQKSCYYLVIVYEW